MYKYQLKFDSVPPSVHAGFYNQTPFYISLSSTKLELESHQINLFSQNSKSSPYQNPQNKWSHLVPQWKFTDSNGEFIEFTTPYFKLSDNQHFMYEASAYYVDNLPSTVTLIATLETSGISVSSDNSEVDLPSYSNSLVYDTISYEILENPYDSLRITQDGINPIDEIKWVGVKIPFVVTFNSNTDTIVNTNMYGLTNVSPLVFSTPSNNLLTYITMTAENIPTSSVVWSHASSIALSSIDDYGFNAGGFYKGWFISNIPSEISKITVEYNTQANYISDFETKPWSDYWERVGAPTDSVSAVLYNGDFWLVSFIDGVNTPTILTHSYIPKGSEVDISFDYTSQGVLYDGMYLRVINTNFTDSGVLCSLPGIFTPLVKKSFNSTFIMPQDGYLAVQGLTYEPMTLPEPFFITAFAVANVRVSVDYTHGESNEFSIKPFERPYDIRRFNESWDSGDYIHSLALPEHFYENNIFFDNFINVSVGGLASSYQSLGRIMYEKIANFVKNNSDIDVCNLNQLYSLHRIIDVPIDDYQISYPSEIRRLVDICSVSKTKLTGGRCKCNRNFISSIEKCYYCNHKHDLNRERISYTSNEYVISANQPFVLENNYAPKNDYRFEVLYPSVCDLNGSNTMLMSSLPNISWLLSSEYSRYSIYNFISSYCNEQTEGVINWSDTYNTLSSSISSINQWYGDNGIVEEMINYEIHRGLYNG